MGRLFFCSEVVVASLAGLAEFGELRLHSSLVASFGERCQFGRFLGETCAVFSEALGILERFRLGRRFVPALALFGTWRKERPSPDFAIAAIVSAALITSSLLYWPSTEALMRPVFHTNT